MRRIFFALALAAISATSAQANEAAVKVAQLSRVAPKCGLQENVTINVNYNFRADSFAEAKKQFDDQNAQVTELARQQKLGKFELQSQNYSINAQAQNYGPDGVPRSFIYQVSGNSTFVLDSADTAFKFAEFLTKQKIQVGLNANSYKNGTCPNSQAVD